MDTPFAALGGIRARRQRLPPSLFNFIAVQSTRWLYPVFPEFSGNSIRNAASYDGLPILIDHSKIEGISDEEITDRFCPEPALQHRLRPELDWSRAAVRQYGQARHEQHGQGWDEERFHGQGDDRHQ